MEAPIKERLETMAKVLDNSYIDEDLAHRAIPLMREAANEIERLEEVAQRFDRCVFKYQIEPEYSDYGRSGQNL